MNRIQIVGRRVGLGLTFGIVGLAACSSTSSFGTHAGTETASESAADAGAVRPAATAPSTRPGTMSNREQEAGVQTLAYPTGDRSTSVLLIEKSFPMQARLGQVYRYQLKVTNLTDATLSNVVVRERFPDSFRAAPAGPATQAAVTAPATRPVGASAISLEAKVDPDARDGREYAVGDLGPRESRTIPVAGVADHLGKLDTATSVTYTPLLLGGTEVINPILQLRMESPADAEFCQELVRKYVVSNIGVGTETNVRIEEKLPDGLVTPEGSREVSIEVGDLPQDRAREFSVRLRPARVGPIVGHAVARGTGTEAQSQELTTTIRAPKLTVAVTGPESEYVGKAASYDLTVTNTGDAPARDTRVETSADNGAQMTFFAGIRPQTAPTTAGASNADASQALGTIKPGGSKKARVAFTPTQGGPVTVRVRASAACADAVAAAARTNVLTIAAPVLDVGGRDDLVRVGESTVYQISVKNQGSGPDKGVRVVATLPPQLAFIKAAGPTDARIDGQKVVFDALPTLAPGITVTWTLDVRAAQPGDVRLRVELTSQTLVEPAMATEATRLY